MDAGQPGASDAQQLEDIRRAFDARAATYDESRMHREVAAAVADFVDLTDVDDVLDVATGTGLMLRALARLSPAIALTGVDVAPAMLEVARRHLPEATFVEADAALVPLADASTDLITCVTALHAIPNTAAALAEWHRLLRPLGRVVSATFVAEGRRGPLQRNHLYPADHRPFETRERLAETVARHGFAITRSMLWSDEVDTLLIAEWLPAPR
ncbi:class I SAM-dependent methyltransferase [Microbacterium murale]|uniref:Ubiquinone/menaquinone biosynthesis C-methylase UbiE n=1 Tax=Microbacterium murale TaxID=1081040 RepID=A0ABU0P3H2_9MICO|nr:class I SAM-dependent methyltransferase [Microbacterium murale]MDQ0641878.1 ubiquinone/menaquinone biosynthesis C-methylase UbiE [Microbacterium murale]